MQTQTQLATNPQAAVPELRVQDVITVTARLAQLLAEEADMLGNMKLKEVEKLQHEKIFLTNALEAHKKLIDRNPHLKETIPAQDKEDLKRIVEVFNDILAENHRKLLLAKEVNHKIVCAIKEVVRDHTTSKTYGAGGMTHYAPFETLSITLDNRV